MGLNWGDICFLVCIVLGIALPEVIIRFHWPFIVLGSLRLAVYLLTCALATFLYHLAYPSSDLATMFVRACIIEGFPRLMLVNTHQIVNQRAAHKGESAS